MMMVEGKCKDVMPMTCTAMRRGRKRVMGNCKGTFTFTSPITMHKISKEVCNHFRTTIAESDRTSQSRT